MPLINYGHMHYGENKVITQNFIRICFCFKYLLKKHQE